MQDQEAIREFLIESNENLNRLGKELIELEQRPDDEKLIASIFRTIHTVKGTSGFFGFTILGSITHIAENILSQVRDKQRPLTPELVSLILETSDAVGAILTHIEGDGQEGEDAYDDLRRRLNEVHQAIATPGAKKSKAASASGTGSTKTPKAASASPAPAKAKEPVAAPIETSSPASSIPVPEQTASGEIRAEDPPVKNMGELLIEKGVKAEDVAAAAREQREGDPRHLGEILVDHGVVKPAAVKAALEEQKEARTSKVSDSTIRVDVGLLDKLMNLVGELVLARNQILQATNGQDATFAATSQRLNLITTELQEGVMKTRLQPIGLVWEKLPRVVRDLASSCGKKIQIEMDGAETELDKTIIEAIKDPLTHIVRNACDHGIELPDVRTRTRKDPQGKLMLRAYHEGGHVIIEVADDGAGISAEKIKGIAIAKGLIRTDQAKDMSEREALSLVFLPGFSTAEKVTNISGRGVGMDVVKTNIEKIGGVVDLHSTFGKGSMVRMKIPLTLAIIPALTVSSAGDRYAIPQVSLLELVRLEGEQVNTSIERVHNAPVLRLRGRLLPLVYLDRELKVSGVAKDSPTPADSQSVNIVVLQADDRQFGLVVDEVNDTEEIVVKPLSKHLKSINMFAGSTIMGDGKVALILDVLGLAQLANVVGEGRDRSRAEEKQASSASDTEHRAVLLFQYGDNGRMAIDLSAVARLEEFSKETIEIAGDRETVQYRGQIMPLIRLSEVLHTKHKATPNQTDSVQVVVHSVQGHNVGLIVDRILDIVDESYSLDQQTGRKGVVGSAVIQQRVTDIVDVAAIVSAMQPGQSLEMPGR
jgi:two-component system, chemotaxis family, sensor kinase CheA